MPSRGNIVIVLLFMLLLAASGLALLTHTGFHQKVIAARRDRRLDASALEQALLLSLHRLREKLAASDMSAFPAPEDDFFNEGNFPAAAESGFLSRHRFTRFILRDAGAFCVTRVLDLIRTGATRGRLAGASMAAARAGVDLVCGDIPAGEFGLLVARASGMAPDAFLAERGVEYAGSLLPQVGGFACTTETRGMLAAALGLPVEATGWRRIREEFGLEPADAPIQPGIYLAEDVDRVRAIFVEGDLEKITFAASAGWQSVIFSRGNRSDELRYRPGLGPIAWSGGGARSAPFEEKIVVHGSVQAVEQAGAAAFLPDARIELLACGRMTVRTGLQGAGQAPGVEKVPALLLMTGGRDFFSGAEVDADVIIDVPGDATLQAQVFSAGTLVNGAARVEVTGSLIARDIENGGKLRIGAAEGRFALDDRILLRSFRFLKNFRVHFIGEGQDEE